MFPWKSRLFWESDKQRNPTSTGVGINILRYDSLIIREAGNNRDDSQDDLELALNLKLKDFSLINKHNLLRPNSKTEWSMWYAGKIARQHSNCVDQISELFAFPGKLSTEITLPDYQVRILVKKLSKRRWECQIPTKNLTKPFYGDGDYGEVASRMTSQHYIFRAFLWLEFDWSKHFAFFLLAETDLVVFSLLTARKRTNKDGFQETSFDRFFRWNFQWQLLVFKSQMACTNFQSEF